MAGTWAGHAVALWLLIGAVSIVVDMASRPLVELRAMRDALAEIGVLATVALLVCVAVEMALGPIALAFTVVKWVDRR